MSSRRFRLQKIGDIVRELRRLYTMAHDKELSWQDAGCGARVLREIRACLEAGELERRIAVLEEAAELNGDLFAPRDPAETHVH
jgi:hypothetical protein